MLVRDISRAFSGTDRTPCSPSFDRDVSRRTNVRMPACVASFGPPRSGFARRMRKRGEMAGPVVRMGRAAATKCQPGAARARTRVV